MRKNASFVSLLGHRNSVWWIPTQVSFPNFESGYQTEFRCLIKSTILTNQHTLYPPWTSITAEPFGFVFGWSARRFWATERIVLMYEEWSAQGKPTPRFAKSIVAQQAWLVGRLCDTKAKIGAHGAGVPPVPIRNTEVKPCSGYYTASTWENSTVPVYRKSHPLWGGFSF